jgi:hypothetical protein
MTTSTLHILSYNSVIDSFALRAASGTILEREPIMGFPKYMQCYFFTESNAYWTLSYMTTSTLHIFIYNGVINDYDFAPRAKDQRETPRSYQKSKEQIETCGA